MELRELLIDLFDRIPEHIHEALDGLEVDALMTPPEPGANPIGWEIWHLTRVQDDHIAEVAGHEQVWSKGDWARRFGVPADPANTGYGHSWKDVMSIRPESVELLFEYYDAVAARTRELIERVTSKDLDRIVDTNWDPPVTMGVRIISVADDDIQHAAHAAYIRGILDRR